MVIYRRYATTFRLDAKAHEGVVRIEEVDAQPMPHYRAVVETTPLRGTFSAAASSIALALDMLNLAMQAEGADEIHFTERKAA